MTRECDVDGCKEVVTIARNRQPCGCWLDGWRVQHGSNPEHSRMYSNTELLVTTGYRPWVRVVHFRETALLDG